MLGGRAEARKPAIRVLSSRLPVSAVEIVRAGARSKKVSRSPPARAELIFRIDLSPAFLAVSGLSSEEVSQELRVRLSRGVIARRVAKVIFATGIRALVEQEAREIAIPFTRRNVQRGSPVVVAGVWVGAGREPQRNLLGLGRRVTVRVGGELA